MTAYVGGSTAAYSDLADVIGDKLPQVIITVVAPQLRSADDRLPLAAGSADRGGDEHALGRRRIRRADGGLREGLGESS